jgi:glycosyltransferase involved in cell wall biosynthesis
MSAGPKDYFDPAFYLAYNPDIAAARVDPFKHYKTHGWKEGRWPTAWFDPSEYIRRFPALIGTDIEPFAHFIANGDPSSAQFVHNRSQENAYQSSSRGDSDKTERGSSFNAKFPHALPSRPTQEDIELTSPQFDEGFYVSNYQDFDKIVASPLLHFLTVGWLEGRDPSPEFSVYHYIQDNKDVRESGVNPFIHYCRYGRFETARRVIGTAEAAVLYTFENDKKIAQMLSEAIDLEPMVALPDIKRNLVIPPRTYQMLAKAARSLRVALAGHTYDYVVLVPHIRMSGAARVSSVFFRTLADMVGEKDILVVCTDSSEAEFQHWFPRNCRLFDGSKIFQSVAAKLRPQLLYDLLRGVRAKSIFNVNSRLTWETMDIYGRQLFQEFRVYTYLFTWDETDNGARVGYPIQWLRHTCAYHHVIFTDNLMLADDIRRRFGFNDSHGAVVTLHTPMENTNVMARRPTDGAKQPVFLWAGRFDRQKRTDLLLAIARQCPQVQFDIYGKPVLDSHGIDPESLPANCRLMGTYKDLGEIFERQHYSGFLYTSQWDGIPTILLDIACIGLPIIASDVGGISELVTDETGWLVRPYDDVSAYIQAINQVIQTPEVARNRVHTMKLHLASDFSATGYRSSLQEALLHDVI